MDIIMRIKRRSFLKCVRLIVVIWMGTMVGSLYVLEKIENPKGQNTQAKRGIYRDAVKCDQSATFNGTFKENLQKLKNVVFNESLPWIQLLDSIRTTSQISTSFPVFVTAANQRYFVRSQGLVKGIIDRLMPVYKKVKIIYFDLGITSSQRDLLKRNCKCEIRQLPVRLLPKHVQDSGTYAFKPVIIYLMYKEFGNVWWLDASARFVTRDIDLPLKYLKENGILFFTFDQTSSITLRTDIRTFNYFNEDPCLYKNFGEIDASAVAFRKRHANDVILRQWLSCALVKDCIAPANATKYCERDYTAPKRFNVIGRCHRFDQSALGIILRRLYHKQNHYPMVEIPFRIIEIRRNEDIQFFYDPMQVKNNKIQT